MQLTNVHSFPKAIVDAIGFIHKKPKKINHLTVTRLIDSPRIRVLTLKNYDEIVEDVSDRIFALFGSAVHAILSWSSETDEDAIVEKRFATKVGSWKVSGQIDYLNTREKLLQDYKVTSVWAVKNGIKPEWERQLNVLAFLAESHGYQIETLQLVAILRDYSAKTITNGFPESQITTINIRKWSKEEVMTYIKERVYLHGEALVSKGSLIECTPEERWERPSTYAVKKPSRKTAIRVFDNLEEAQALAASTPQGYVETRHGQALRCGSYCAVSKFCDQYAATQTTEENTVNIAA